MAVYLADIAYTLVNVLNPDVIYFGDEIPCIEEYKAEIVADLEKISNAETAKVVNILYYSFIQRDSKNDPALKGAARYVLDASIEVFDTFVGPDGE